MCAGEAGLLISEVGFGSLFAPVVLAQLKSVPHLNWLLVGQNLIFGWACFFGLVSLGLDILVHHISCGNHKHGFYGNKGTATYCAIGDTGAGLEFMLRWGWVHVHRAVINGNGSEALNGQIAIIGGAAMFPLISLELGLLRPYLRRLKIQRARV